MKMHAGVRISVRLLMRIWGLLLCTAFLGFSSKQSISPSEKQPTQKLHAVVQLLLLRSLHMSAYGHQVEMYCPSHDLETLMMTA